jgi:HEPN domain-containing protein
LFKVFAIKNTTRQINFFQWRVEIFFAKQSLNLTIRQGTTLPLLAFLVFELIPYFYLIMPAQKDFQKIAKCRLAEAKHLFKEKKYEGASYLIGYTIETALKARICKVLNLSDYPPKIARQESFKTHSIDALIILAGLEKDLEAKKYADPAFAANWSVSTGWKETWRYEKIGTVTKEKTKELIKAVSNRTSGIFPWIKTKW